VVLCAIHSIFPARPKNDRHDHRTYMHGVLAPLGAESLLQWLPYRHGFRPVRLACLNGASDTIFGGPTHPAFWISLATQPSSTGRWRQQKQCPRKVAPSKFPHRRQARFATRFSSAKDPVSRVCALDKASEGFRSPRRTHDDSLSLLRFFRITPRLSRRGQRGSERVRRSVSSRRLVCVRVTRRIHLLR
jgi:hypothetical protein